jgi:hypothetical protein
MADGRLLGQRHSGNCPDVDASCSESDVKFALLRLCPSRMQCLKSAAVHTTFIGLRLTRRPDALPGLHTPARTTRSARCYAEAEAPASSTGFWTIAAPQEHVAEVKKSRFLAYAWPITSSQQVTNLAAGIQ